MSLSIGTILPILIIGFLTLPIIIGYFSGLAADTRHTVDPVAWRHLEEDPFAPPKEKPIFNSENESLEEQALDFDFELEDEEEQEQVSAVGFDIEEDDSSQEKVYETSEPSKDMNSSINELLNAINGEETPDSELDLDFVDLEEEVKGEDSEAALEELVQEVNGIETNTDVDSEKESDDVVFDSYIPPSPIPQYEYQAIKDHFGEKVADTITLTPSSTEGAGESDVMIGRLTVNTVGYVLSYKESFIPLKGDIPKELKEQPVMLHGQFIDQEHFYVLQWADPTKFQNAQSFYETEGLALAQ
ncbi:hypothetical protein J2S74_002966 [Evansella vedderi]|uniref:Uncharacterized protein n=1 Tax=Evansella vedderi TaxID=38282 RepID=A0ABT9ZWJ0_9BACI|nr:hypothetical protein [Evansella vedderi]MDQ0255584.1 hypothetical protein [Evansella vedderi]